MSNHNRNKKQSRPFFRLNNPWIWIIAALVVLAVVAIVVASVPRWEDPQPTVPTQPSISIEIPSDIKLQLDEGLEVTDVGSYDGPYLEDGSDEMVANVLMIIVKNSGDQTLQYTKIRLQGSTGEAVFALSTLEPGKSAVVLEESRKLYTDGETFSSGTLENLVFFTEPLSVQSDKLKIQGLNGALNVTNISGEDISGDIVIYYKNSATDILYGGITYRARITGGLKAGELKQVMTSHFTTDGSTILFVTCG